MKKKFSIIFICALALGLAVCVTGCRDKSSSSAEESVVNPINLLISIDYPGKANKPDLENFKFKAEEDSSVLEATELYCNISEIQLLVDTTNNEVQGINGINNGELKKKYVWKYKINGKEVSDNPQDYDLKDGDNIIWYYTKK
ncbi:DUF4430 domain-containing protein [Hornefia butyriciproducens]|uniref:DUF4430 domain-containing protein n=1 Tax=Hornefia butyriciproducens TaxID=2652293 RepID=A0A6L5Y339_9FIRM|nr:DUF4430 domain-containing protein [Hornefia butyriciproducens]MDY2991445.1 DUF4430 domain-containing protein [Hornefia butyriciproducens]MST51194.1 DUF4430 domain-containing protein [Hornefia butyriciproducens]